MSSEAVYNPLSMEHIGQSLARAIEAVEPVPMDNLPSMYGAGVYAIYYTGNFPAYRRMAAANANGAWKHAIYVGKAIPPGARSGDALADASSNIALRTRLRQHVRSLEAAQNLNLSDFHARWLVIEPVWIPLAETVMIQRTACVWNKLVAGFGVNAQGSGRTGGKISTWDILHPGRDRQGVMPENPDEIRANVIQEIEGFLSQRI